MNNIYENKFKKYKSKYLKLKNEYNGEGGYYYFWPSERENILKQRLIEEQPELEKRKHPVIEIKTQLNDINIVIAAINKKIKPLLKQSIEKKNILDLIELKKNYNMSEKMKDVFEEELEKEKKKKITIEEEKKAFILYEELTVIKKAITQLNVLNQNAINKSDFEETLVTAEQIKILTNKLTVVNQKYLELKKDDNYKQEIEKVHEQKVLIKIFSKIKEENNKNVEYNKNIYEMKLEELSKKMKIKDEFQKKLKNGTVYDLHVMFNEQDKDYKNTIDRIASEENKLNKENEKYNILYNEYKILNNIYLEQKNIVDNILSQLNEYFWF